MLTPSPPIRCALEGQITVDFGRHRLTVDGRVALEGVAHAYLGRWLGLVEDGLVAPPPGYPDCARFSLTDERLELPVLPEDAVVVRRLLAVLFHRPGILTPVRRR